MTAIDPGTLILIADAIKNAVSIEAARAPLETIKTFNEQLLKLAVAARHKIDGGSVADVPRD